jgi:hypothetical protein
MPSQTLNIANTLASHLAGHDIASLRYDKRGVGASSGDYLRTGFEEERRDAAQALETLHRVEGVDTGRIGVIGHSVGATIAIGLASGRDQLAAVVFLGAAARSGLDVMQHQSERIAATMSWWQRPRRFLRNQERDRRLLLESREEIVTIDGQELPARWFREYMQYDPSDDLGTITCPVLAISGASDVQVDPGDVDRIGRAVRGEFTGQKPEHLTHLLRTDVGPPGLRGYPAQMRKPMDTGLLNMISAWLATRPRR